MLIAPYPRFHTIDVTLYADVDLEYLAEAVCVKFLHCKVPCFPLSILYSLEGSCNVQPTLKE